MIMMRRDKDKDEDRDDDKGKDKSAKPAEDKTKVAAKEPKKK